MKQYVLTPAAGKRLIGKALVDHHAVTSALNSGTLVIVAGTTNGYAAEEILAYIGQGEGFSRKKFFRGVTLPPHRPTTDTGRLSDESEFPGDVVITNGTWQKGKTIFDVVEDLKKGDVILKGANALDLACQRAALLIGHPQAGTIGVALQAVLGRRVQLILPVGLEKRIDGDLDQIAQQMNAPSTSGPRFWPVPGEVFTELDAIALLTGAKAELIASGGVCGAEGSVWLAVSGTEDQLKDVDELIKPIIPEPPFEL
ncbi:hypothetical protein JXA32_11355 [Candidatus Sumerlaeota bacterium]|nr:hypothetical protein [Candidatus Sumerlaeota bacterium]